ncbi:hypothetical protein ACFQ05_09535 [Amycolatopsis umgeniensis]|uniref:Uncharacterized protein n=1 Tax=Amycolatopsis umgeniensis TaxID=336628 RepID=A0A841B474_9PSEU|nr:hypothetical protein [Amycolatopsis umgeniensis]MBB5853535.1 hypothetical protein [Amycolatopsis umgeniensis]
MTERKPMGVTSGGGPVLRARPLDVEETAGVAKATFGTPGVPKVAFATCLTSAGRLE